MKYVQVHFPGRLCNIQRHHLTVNTTNVKSEHEMIVAFLELLNPVSGLMSLTPVANAHYFVFYCF